MLPLPLPYLQPLSSQALILPALVPKEEFPPLIQGAIHLGKSSPGMEGKPANRPKQPAAVGSNSQRTGIHKVCMTWTVQMNQHKQISQIRIRPIMQRFAQCPNPIASSRRSSSSICQICGFLADDQMLTTSNSPSNENNSSLPIRICTEYNLSNTPYLHLIALLLRFQLQATGARSTIGRSMPPSKSVPLEWLWMFFVPFTSDTLRGARLLGDLILSSIDPRRRRRTRTQRSARRPRD